MCSPFACCFCPAPVPIWVWIHLFFFIGCNAASGHEVAALALKSKRGEASEKINIAVDVFMECYQKTVSIIDSHDLWHCKALHCTSCVNLHVNRLLLCLIWDTGADNTIECITAAFLYNLLLDQQCLALEVLGDVTALESFAALQWCLKPHSSFSTMDRDCRPSLLVCLLE